MSAQSTVQSPSALRRLLNKSIGALALGLALTLAAIGAYRASQPPPVETQAPTSIAPVSLAPDPAQLGVMGYINAHESGAKVPAIDPAQQSVIDYLRIHGAPIE
jgi:multidrug efflux pump subunit AcrA (membrane-fusion protein)